MVPSMLSCRITTTNLNNVHEILSEVSMLKKCKAKMQFLNLSLYNFQPNQLIETLLTSLETLKSWLFSIVYIDSI